MVLENEHRDAALVGAAQPPLRWGDWQHRGRRTPREGMASIRDGHYDASVATMPPRRRMQRRAYIETTIPSFYFTARRGASSIARRDWTRAWWVEARERFELVTSRAVLAELLHGSHAQTADRVRLLAGLELLEPDDAVAEVMEAYVRNRVMPADPGGDALHLALATVHRCDFLVTWNCRHIANANKFDHIRRVNTMMGLSTPNLVTPLELLGVDDDN
jgi:predicted nucleic acid-binding protein